MTKFDKDYKDMVKDVLTYGAEYRNRNAPTLALFPATFTVDFANGFPILSLRKIAFKQAVGEFIGFLRGYTKKSEFNSVGCTYWDTTPAFKDLDASINCRQDLLSPANDELGPIYGKQWRDFNCEYYDQLQILINNIRTDPFSRRHILQSWNPAQTYSMALPPCHLGAQFHIDNQGDLHCSVWMRSLDVMLGFPYDVIVYSLLMHVIEAKTGYRAAKLYFMLGNTHIYTKHTENAVKLLEVDPPYHLAPCLIVDPAVKNLDLYDIQPEHFSLDSYMPVDNDLKFELFV